MTAICISSELLLQVAELLPTDRVMQFDISEFCQFLLL